MISTLYRFFQKKNLYNIDVELGKTRKRRRGKEGVKVERQDIRKFEENETKTII